MTTEERDAVALCCGILEGVAGRNTVDYANKIILGVKVIKGILQKRPNKRIKVYDGDIRFPPPREKCKHCRNWLTQEDVGFNDYPHCLVEYDISVSDYMSKLSDDCKKHLED